MVFWKDQIGELVRDGGKHGGSETCHNFLQMFSPSKSINVLLLSWLDIRYYQIPVIDKGALSLKGESYLLIPPMLNCLFCIGL